MLSYLGWTALAEAGTTITRMEVVLEIALDGSMLVRESMTITADTSHSPPYRDVSLHSIDPSRQLPMTIDVLNVEHFDQLSRWQTQFSEDAMRIHLANPSRKLPRGRHTYELLYYVDGHLLSSRQHEMLLWRPLGPGMSSAVQNLTVKIRFARPFKGDTVKVLTGIKGSTTTYPFTTRIGNDGTVDLAFNNTLVAYAAPGIAVAWPKGRLDIASNSETTPWMRPDARGLYWVTATLIIALSLVLGGRFVRTERRTLLIGISVLVSFLGCYWGGRMLSLDVTRFNIDFLFAVSLLLTIWLLRSWLMIPQKVLAYGTLSAMLILFIAWRLAINTSPWYPLLVLAHVDIYFIGTLLEGYKLKRHPRPRNSRPDIPVTDTTFADGLKREKVRHQRPQQKPFRTPHQQLHQRQEPRFDPVAVNEGDHVSDKTDRSPPEPFILPQDVRKPR
ncbi:MAG: hypothetical protein DHS20C01_02790 [marine bacterium B5-7]|nr:MAG: hypothetical protein DHS20C01_02790 [marine bacterium B5-7]